MAGTEKFWHVCPACGLAGPVDRPDGFYCLLHSQADVEASPSDDNLTAIERVLGRKILQDPPSLRDWITRFGGYAKITPEGWADYNRAMNEWRGCLLDAA